MAIGLVFFAALLALPVALGAWALGHVTVLGALLMYVGTGWSVLIAGLLSTGLAHLLSRPRRTQGDRSPVRIEVRVVPRA
jgi:uncharacterized membrane protein YjjB (DUF3815 family)